MNRLGSSDSMEALMSICPTTEEMSKHGYKKKELQTMIMEGMDEEEQISEKKRRLGVDQVKALEKNFEMENKLEPERKVKLAQEIGLQPRQVAVWFQNRRARWKTKQLERDYALLKANFDSLKLNYDSLIHHNDSLNKQIAELKSKLYNEKAKSPETSADDDAADMINGGGENVVALSNYFPDGPSDSDSSAILNEEINSSNAAASASHHVTATKAVAEMNCNQFPESIIGDAEKAYQPQFVKIEEFNFFSGDESCNFFSADQAPTLQWYCQDDQWNATDNN